MIYFVACAAPLTTVTAARDAGVKEEEEEEKQHTTARLKYHCRNKTELASLERLR